MTVLNTHKVDYRPPSFFGPYVGLNRHDNPRHPFFVGLIKQQWSFFWQPEEIRLVQDSIDFKNLTDTERHIFTSNLKRQILLDSVQGRAPVSVFGPICTNPELETWIRTWSMFEDIHSYSYRYILENVYPDTTAVYDETLVIPEILECAKSISEYYDDLDHVNTRIRYGEGEYVSMLEHKKSLWQCLNAVNILEGIRFYVSFACSWAFAESKKMEGNAKIIRLIARDENLHLGGTQYLLKALPKEDEDFANISKEMAQKNVELFMDAIEQEKQWAKYLFQYGSVVGLNEQLLCDYIEWIGHKRMLSIGLPSPYKGVGSNPLPWTESWIKGSDIQEAPQEVEKGQYTLGGVAQDVSSETFRGFKL